jgi:hypothetical protein
MDYRKKYYKYKEKYINLRGGGRCSDFLKRINDTILNRNDIDNTNKLRQIHSLMILITRIKEDDPECNKAVLLIEELIHDIQIDDNNKIQTIQKISSGVNLSSINLKSLKKVESPKSPTKQPIVPIKSPTKQAVVPEVNVPVKSPTKQAVVPELNVSGKSPTNQAVVPELNVSGKSPTKQAVVPGVKSPTKQPVSPKSLAKQPLYAKEIGLPIETQKASQKASQKTNLIAQPIEADIELYTPIYGGDSENIWPIISTEYNKNNRLGIKGQTNTNVNFRIIEKHSNKNDKPIFGRGTFTAVYQMKNEINKSDTVTYILRIFERNTGLFYDHFMKNPKIIEEFRKYPEYLIKIYYYGQLKIKSNEFEYIKGKTPDDLQFDSDNDNYKLLPNLKDYAFDYTVTKLYNIPKYNDQYVITNLTNLQKFNFLYNNIVMLKKLADNNEFHADYKIGNVGWDNTDTLNVIMIDYDEDTIQEATVKNRMLHLNKQNKQNKVDIIYFSSTYIPEYLKNINECTLPDNSKRVGYPCVIPNYTPEQFIKFSVGGLHTIIQTLDIQYNTSLINIPTTLSINKRGISNLDTNNLENSLNLNNINYDLIPTYVEIIELFDYIRNKNYIS